MLTHLTCGALLQLGADAAKGLGGRLRPFRKSERISMRLRALLVVGAAINFALPANARNLTIALQSGLPDAPAIETILRQALLRPFTETTFTPITQVTWPGGLAALHPTAPELLPWDMVEITEADLRPACDQGLLEKLDWGAIGGREHYLPAAVSDCGVGTYLQNLVLAWNPQKFPGQLSWSDFWDVAKVPGKRGLARHAHDNLEIALLADGVAQADVYTTLRTNEGIDRAFRKLDQLRPYLVWWGADSAPSRLLDSGDVLMSSALADQIITLPPPGGAQRNLAVQWTGSLYSVIDWAIPKGSPNLTDANHFLIFASDPTRQAALLPFGSLVKGASDKLPPEQLATLPTANLANALHIDWAFWRENGAKLEARFAEWVGH
jgi:putative spermidine/putrescine transport system substrate-binding protein